MSDQITVRGFVATAPVTRKTRIGQDMASFRLATTERRFDRESQSWVDGTTNWYTVNMFRSLASNAGICVHKGQPVIVTGRLRVRDWQTEERSGTAVEIEADAVGHDLTWGTSMFGRVSPQTADDTEDEADGQAPAAGDGAAGEVTETEPASDPQDSEPQDAPAWGTPSDAGRPLAPAY